MTHPASKRWVLTTDQAAELLAYYPDDPIGSPYGWGNITWPDKGLLYKRYSSMAGDITMHAPRRLLAQTMAKYKQPVYSYRWDVAALNDSNTIGVSHFAEVSKAGLSGRPVPVSFKYPEIPNSKGSK